MALLKEPFLHGSGAEAPGGQMDPDSQGSQPVAPAQDWNVPPPQNSHSSCPSTSVNDPGVHDLGSTVPDAQRLPGGQG